MRTCGTSAVRHVPHRLPYIADTPGKLSTGTVTTVTSPDEVPEVLERQDQRSDQHVYWWHLSWRTCHQVPDLPVTMDRRPRHFRHLEQTQPHCLSWQSTSLRGPDDPGDSSP